MRSVIALLLLLGAASADMIRIDHREGTTGNYAPVPLTTTPNYVLTFDAGGNPIIAAQSGSGGGISDGDKGDVTVSASGATWTVDAGAISLAKMANLAQARLIGRWTASTGVPEAITIGGDFLTTAGTLSIAAAIARDSEVSAAIAAAGAGNNTWTGTNTFANVTASASSVWNLTAATLTLPPISGALEVTTEAYDATGWNADNSVPTKDAVRDKIESMSSGGVAAGDSPTWTGAHIFSKAGAASAPTIKLTGLPFTGGDATTTKPLLLLEPTGTTSTGWSTLGTMLGVNAASGFAGNLIEAQLNAVARFKVDSTGVVTSNAVAGVRAFSAIATGTGIGGAASNALDFWSANNVYGQLYGGDAFVAASSGGFGISSAASGSALHASVDVALRRLGAGNLRLGKTPSASPLAQTFTIGEASRPGTDSNIAGANGTIQSGLGTGTGVASQLIFQTPTVAASGSTTQTYTTRLTLDANGATIPAIDLGTTLATDDTSRGTVRSGFNNSGGVTQWDAVYLNGSSQWVLADANGSGTYPCRGLVTATATTGLASTVITSGTVRNDAWTWTPGGNVYLSVTAGGLTQTVPATTGDKIQIVGYALNADTLALEISTDYGTSP